MLDKNYVKHRAEKLRQELATWPPSLREMPTSKELDIAARSAKENVAAARSKKK